MSTVILVVNGYIRSKGSFIVLTSFLSSFKFGSMGFREDWENTAHFHNLVNLIIKLTLNQTKVQVNQLEETIFCVYCTKRSLLIHNPPLCWGYITV